MRVFNDTDVETTVYWHGVRLENAFDCVPSGKESHNGTQVPIFVGESFIYRLRFPDPGVF